MTLSDFRYLASNTAEGFSAMGYNPETGSFVIIGPQQWETENLDVTTYRDGTLIPEITDQTQWASQTTGAWCYYENNPVYGATYGKLYNWYAVAGIDGSGIERKLAPEGYHIPTNGEWTTLINTLGGYTVAGGALKQTGSTNWAFSIDSGSTNSSGFTALPGGYRLANAFFSLNFYGIFWTSTPSTQINPEYGNYAFLYYNSAAMSSGLYDLYGGFSVRAIKERPSPETVLLYNLDASGTARIEAVAINLSEYNLRELDRVTMINLSPSGSENIINIPVSDADVPYRRVEKNVSGDYYIYAISPPSQQPIITRPTSGSTGTATAGTTNTITIARSFPTYTLKAFTIKLTSGTGAGQVRSIIANSGTSVTVAPDWTTQPTSGTGYAIFGIPQYYTSLYVEYISSTLKHQGVDYDTTERIDTATESTSIYKVDKSTQSSTGNNLTTSRTSPINLHSILNKQSPFASVQDSNYTSIPWRNARYDGSIMTTNNNQGYPPFTHGSFIEGAFFSKETSDSYIDNLITTNTIEYRQYFSLSQLDTPQYLLEDLNLITTAEFTTSGSVLELRTGEITTPSKDIALGDVLVLTIPNQAESPIERLQVTTPNPPALYSPYEFRIKTATVGEFSSIKLTRGYTNTPRSSYPASSSLSRVVPVRILELSNSKLTPVIDGKFKTKGRQDTLFLSIDGYVVSGSGAFNI